MLHTFFALGFLALAPVGAVCPSCPGDGDAFALQGAGVPPQEAVYLEEIRRLRQDDRVERALAFIEADDARTIQSLVELTEIPAPPFQENARGARFLEMLEEAGVGSAWVDEEGNVLGLRRGRGSSEGAIALAGHLDTVFPEETDVRVERRADTLFAPGIGDNSRGLAALLAILRAMNHADVQTERDVLFIGNVGEEGLGDLRGVKHLFRPGSPAITAFISIDGTGDQEIIHKALGSHRYLVTFAGPGGHSWGDFGQANPAHALGQAIHHFVLAARDFTSDGPRTSYNVGRVGGGTSVNSIPFESWMEVDLRSESPARLAHIDSLLHRSAQRALDEANAERRGGPVLTVEVELVGSRPSGEVSPGRPLVQRAIAVTRALGLDPILARASTDANVPIALGVPAITIGAGAVSGGTHAPEEWLVNRNGPRGIQRALLILLAQSGLAASD